MVLVKLFMVMIVGKESAEGWGEEGEEEGGRGGGGGRTCRVTIRQM